MKFTKMKIENFANNFEAICTVTYGTNGNGICWVDETDTETKEKLLETEFDEIKPFAEFGNNPKQWLIDNGWDDEVDGKINDETIKKLTIAICLGKDSQGYYNNQNWAIIY